MDHGDLEFDVGNIIANFTDLLSDFVGVAEKNGKMLFVNRAGREMAGIGKDGVISSLRIHELYPDWSVAKLICEGIADETSNQSSSHETTLWTLQGQKVPVLLTVQAHLLDDGMVGYFSMIARPMTDITPLEKDRALYKQCCLNRINREFIGNYASLIRGKHINMLTKIIGNNELALEFIDDAQKASRYLSSAIEESVRLTGIIRIIQILSDRASAKPRPVEIHSIVKNALLLLDCAIPSGVVIQHNIDCNAGLILADSVEIYRAVFILCTRAGVILQKSGGVVNVTLSVVDLDEGGKGSHAGQYMHLMISDNGPGMDPSVAERIFEPDFSKDGEGEWNVSLFPIHEFVDSCGGSIELRKRPGGGSMFCIYLPMIDTQEHSNGHDL